jgi:hypothetical protein
MKISDLKDEYLAYELKEFQGIFQSILDGEDIDPDILRFITMRMASLQNQVDTFIEGQHS